MFFKKICCSFMLLGFGTVLAATTNYNRFNIGGHCGNFLGANTTTPRPETNETVKNEIDKIMMKFIPNDDF